MEAVDAFGTVLRERRLQAGLTQEQLSRSEFPLGELTKEEVRNLARRVNTSWRAAFAGIDRHEHVGRFVDMHDVGDMLVHAGFADPVMDMEHLTLTYADAAAMSQSPSTSRIV